jgi:hypothetical protein
MTTEIAKLGQYLSKIVGHELVPPDQLLANPNNFRIHSRQQKDAMKATLREVGWLDEIIVNHNSGNIVNGHMRADIALEENEPLVPVRYVDLSDEEEKLALAIFDNVGAMATTDRDVLNSLLAQTRTSDDVLGSFLDSLKPSSIPESDEPMADVSNEDMGEEQYLILVTCESEEDQVAMLERFEEEGILCRALNSA